jgi:N-acetylglucosamine-6-sulfatase
LIYYYGVNYEGKQQTPPGWELYDLVNDPTEVVNQIDNPDYAEIAKELKQRLADLRQQVGDDGSHYPAVEEVVQEFWDYSDEDRQKAIKISHEYSQAMQSGK